ncbi:MAG TPA: alpha/beta hydrolase [Roseococcus sp.]|jgi:pimeloyl-ACP methyl ester carboxylesterase|nr:alpha/beta hydrolase [Roseococcus sp.]
MPMIETRDGTRLHVKRWGEGRPVVLTHGWPLNADSWDDQALVLAEAGFRVIAYDRRGFGRSDQPWHGYDYDTLADDLADVMGATDATDATLVGFSMGGGEVARYMSRHGGKGVRQCGLVASVVPYMLQGPDNPDGVPAATFAEMTAQMRKDRPAFFATFFRAFYGVGTFSHPVSAEVIEWARQMALMAGLRPTLACARAFATTDFRPDMPAINVPTLIIHGTADATVPIDASGRAAAAGIAQAQFIEYDGAPHGLTATHKDRLSQDLLAFLRQ